MARVAVIGGGAWGTALALVLGRKQTHHVTLWAYEPEVVASVNARRVNQLFLPGFELPAAITATGDLGRALDAAEMVVTVMPSHHCRTVVQHMTPALKPDMLFVSATKGIENDSFLRMTEVISAVVQQRAGFVPRIAALSGPSFAKEVAKGDPTAITAASADSECAAAAQREFSDPNFRVYTNDDVVGVELGGALKNVIAIAAGVCDGLGLGHNTIAALITRGLAEISRLAVACGARRDTLAGLAGMGDLVLTCTGGLSRNRSVGVELGRGRPLDEIIASMHGMVAEGVLTTRAAIGLAGRHGVEIPITSQMDAILQGRIHPREAIRELMSRPGRTE